MTRTARALALALGMAALSSHPVAAAPADSAALQFHGFRAGAPLAELASRLRTLNGAKLRCQDSRADRRVSECRASFTAPELGGKVDVWVSAIDSVAGIITLSGDVDGTRLDRWREGIEASYGRVGARAQGTQWMMQWVRRGRMLRLTWRLERAGKVASVSLVDGRVLDAWGRSRDRTSLVVGDTAR